MIVAELLKIQKQRGLTNEQFAESLGIHTLSWYRNKRTKLISAEVILKAFVVYPELKDALLSSIPTNRKKVSSTTIHNIPEKPQNQQESLFRRFYDAVYYRLKKWICYR